MSIEQEDGILRSGQAMKTQRRLRTDCDSPDRISSARSIPAESATSLFDRTFVVNVALG